MRRTSMGSPTAQPTRMSVAKPWALRPTPLNERKDYACEPGFARNERFPVISTPGRVSRAIARAKIVATINVPGFVVPALTASPAGVF